MLSSWVTFIPETYLSFCVVNWLELPLVPGWHAFEISEICQVWLTVCPTHKRRWKETLQEWPTCIYFIATPKWPWHNVPGEKSWHGSYLILEPSQRSPPFWGGGFEHNRFNIFLPAPHLGALQGENSCHSDQPPSTVNKYNMSTKQFNLHAT